MSGPSRGKRRPVKDTAPASPSNAALRARVVALDLMMPEMDGFDFLEELRGDEAGRHVPVVVITARDLTAEDHRRLNGSVERILQKGAYGREELLAEVRRLVRASIDKRRAAP